MKVFFVCEGLTLDSARAQPWRHVVEVAKRLQKSGNEVQIISDGKHALQNDEDIAGLHIRRVGRSHFFLDTHEITRTVDEEHAEVTNWHGSDTWSSFYLSRLNNISSATVWTLHSGPLSMRDLRGLELREKLQLFKYWNNVSSSVFPRCLIRKWVRASKVRRVITLSERLALYLEEIGIHAEVETIRSGVDTQRFRPLNSEDARAKLGLSKEDLIILYYGPLSTFRGVDTLTMAMPEIKRKVPSAKLLLLGREKDAKAERRLTFDSFSELRVGIFDEDTLIQYLASADLVVLPFKFWPQVECPLTILESMAMGKPVVSTCTGAIPEIITSGQDGMLVPSGNPNILAEKIIELLEDEETRKRIGLNAREHVERYYDWNRIVAQTLDVFVNALESG